MKLFFIAILTVMFSGKALALACNDLRDQIQVSYPSGFGGIVNAGDVVHLQVKIAVANTEIFAAVPWLPILFQIKNDLSGSSTFSEFLWLKERRVDPVPSEKTFDIQFLVPQNFVGRYHPKASFSFVFETEYCGDTLADQPGAMIDVINERGGDILPPVISQLSFDRTAYKIGGDAVLTFSAFDQNAVCTIEKQKTGMCSAAWHLALRNSRVGDDIHLNAEIFDTDVAGQYQVRFSVEREDENSNPLFQPGDYQVEVLNVSDIWGNVVADVLPALRKRFTVTE